MNNTITAIQPSEDDPNLRSIFVGDDCVATLNANIIEVLGLEVGKSWNQDSSQSVESHHELQHARQIAIDLISRRMWGSKELEYRLVQRGVSKEIAVQTTKTLNEDDWLDDHAFAKALLIEWTRKEPASKLWLEKKLRDKNIDTSIAKRAVLNSFQNTTEQEAANQFAKQRIERIIDLEFDLRRKKVLGALQRKGFSGEVSFQAMKHAEEESHP